MCTASPTTRSRAPAPKQCIGAKFRSEPRSPSRNGNNLPSAGFRLGRKTEKILQFFPHRFVFSPPPAPLGCFLSLAVLQPCPQCHCSADVLQSDSAGAQHVCAQQAGSPFFRQLCEGKHFPLPLFPPHYNSEIYLLPLCPPSSRLCWESLIAALS